MYKIDDEFRPPGRVFMKAQRENPVPVPTRKSSLKQQQHHQQLVKGPAITTNLDDRNIQFQHEVTHEKTVQALITEYPPNYNQHNQNNQHVISRAPAIQSAPTNGNELVLASSTTGHFNPMMNNISSFQAITRNKRIATEVLGSSLETTKTSHRAPDGHRRTTTHIVRKVTTMSRAEESADAQNMMRTAKDVRTTEFGYESTRAIEPKRVKVTTTTIINFIQLVK